MRQWWITPRIDTDLTRDYVVKQLLPEEVQRLDQPVAFEAEDLTERSYWDSIQNDARRLFLILVDLGIPDQIFGIVDDGWNDSELPLGIEDVERLQLTAVKDERIDRKFHQRQFFYLLRTIDRGEHVNYDAHEVVPLDVVERPGHLTSSKSNYSDKVKIPNARNTIFTRQKYSLGDGKGSISAEEFLDIVSTIRGLRNDHIVSYWGSYTHQGFGYLLLTPSSDYTLKAFLATAPSSYKALGKKARRELTMNWILCLADTMSFLHSYDRAHCFIKPSTILFSTDHHIFLTDPSRVGPDSWVPKSSKASFDREWYNFAAPEQWLRPVGQSNPSQGQPLLGPYSMSPGSDDAEFLPPPQVPNPQLNPQQADIFSLGCVFLELLSYLVKRSASKFAAFRAAKHKKGGRGGAVLDSSYHKNLGQVEAWMSIIAKDAANRRSDPVSGHVFRGVIPMLHIVAGMLSAIPHERPSAMEVQQAVYGILTETCGLREPHCVHQYSTGLQQPLNQLHLGDRRLFSDQLHHRQVGSPEQRTVRHGRSSSSGGYSQTSGTSSNTTLSSDRDPEISLAIARGIPVPQRTNSTLGPWPLASTYEGRAGEPSSAYASVHQRYS